MKIKSTQICMLTILANAMEDGKYELDDGKIINERPETITMDGTTFEFQDESVVPDCLMWNYSRVDLD